MNANDLLQMQHREIEQKYRRFSAAGGRRRGEIGKDILTDLAAHAETEEELYYPALASAGDEDRADRYRAEHAEMKALVAQLSMMSEDDRAYAPTMEALMETVIAHAKEEEAEGMPEAAHLLGPAKLEELGPKMERRFAELKESALKRLWAAIT